MIFFGCCSVRRKLKTFCHPIIHLEHFGLVGRAKTQRVSECVRRDEVVSAAPNAIALRLIEVECSRGQGPDRRLSGNEISEPIFGQHLLGSVGSICERLFRIMDFPKDDQQMCAVFFRHEPHDFVWTVRGNGRHAMPTRRNIQCELPLRTLVMFHLGLVHSDEIAICGARVCDPQPRLIEPAPID